MNISSSYQFTYPHTANHTSSAQIKVDQVQIEHRASTVQPLDKIATSDPTRHLYSPTPVTDSNSKASDKRDVAGDHEVGPHAQRQPQQEALVNELERHKVQDLVLQDQQVREHERAHETVGGQYASSPRYTFERGPDGINYAMSGEVAISSAAVAGDPEATIQKAQIVRRAALAPAEPSAQDRSVAAQATQIESQAIIELRNIESQTRIAEIEATEVRIENRLAASDGQTLQARDESVSTDALSYDLQDSMAGNTERRVQRLSDDLNLRVSRADPFGGPEPGQIFNQFI
jgi:hypothetical protein